MLVFAVAFLAPNMLMPAQAAAASVEVVTEGASDIGATSATLNATLYTLDSDFTVTKYGFYYGVDVKRVNDSTSDYMVTVGDPLAEGEDFSFDLANLDADQTYYFKAYVVYEDARSNGATAYGYVESFLTGGSEGVPRVTTDNATDIRSNSATLNGVIDSFGNDNEIIEYGFYYGTSASISSKVEVGDESDNIYEGDGFYCELRGLKSNTKYYFQAYAENSEGKGYGNVRSFTTEKSGDIPIITTKPASTGAGFATLYGVVTDAGDSGITSYGFYYGLTSSPGTRLVVGDKLGEDETFSYQLSDLTPGKTYYVKAYAANAAGTGYGSVQSFKAGIAPSIFTVGSTFYNLRGSNLTMDVAPYIRYDRTYLPVRYSAYAMGLTDSQIHWNAFDPQTVTLTDDTTTVVLKIGSRTMYKNGTPITMDVAPEVVNYRTCLPISWVTAAFGYTASWDESARTVTIDQ